MPVMGGLEAAALIRQWEGTGQRGERGRCAMIAMSSNAGPDFVARSTQAGFDRYLTKLVSLDAIWRAIADLARGLLARCRWACAPTRRCRSKRVCVAPCPASPAARCR